MGVVLHLGVAVVVRLEGAEEAESLLPVGEALRLDLVLALDS
jgi:hypothetical protein